MTTKYAAKFGAGLINTHRAIRKRETFDAGNLYAFEGKAFKFGALPSVFRHLIEDADYVVYSYQTPIAWHSPTLGWIVPAYSYSPTTSGHQSTVRNALAGNGAYVSGRGWVYPGDDLGEDNGYIPFERTTWGEPYIYEGKEWTDARDIVLSPVKYGFPREYRLSRAFQSADNLAGLKPGDVVKVTFTGKGYIRTLEAVPGYAR